MVSAMARLIGSAMRGYMLDFLPIPRSTGHSEVALLVCRLLGCAAVVAVAAISVQHAGTISASQSIPFALLVMTIALPVGNLIKEVGILLGGIALNRLGLEFCRTRLAVDGTSLVERYRSNGTWDRYIGAAGGTIHEWSDPDGGCHREILDTGHSASGSDFSHG